MVDALQIGILAQIGYVVGYVDEYEGAKVHEIALASPAVKHPKRSQQPAALGAHNDRARYPDIAQTDIISLLGLRNPEGVATQFAPIAETLRRIPDRLRRALYQERFDFTKDGRFAQFRPILREIDGELIVCLPPEDLPCDDEAMEAQTLLRRATLEVSGSGVVIQPGMMLLIRNRTCLHWREAIQSPQRWLRRAYCIVPDKYEQLLSRGLLNPSTLVLSPSLYA
jgi:hypothetical protein